MTHRRGQYNVDAYFVYRATTCCHDDEAKDKICVGASAILKGQTLRLAVGVRKRNMQKLRVKWLEQEDLDNLDLEVVWPRLQKDAALVEEARLAAAEHQSSETLARGGPWCRKVLPPEDLKEIRLVAACSSRAEVQALARRYPSGSLAYHLGGKSYREPCEEPIAQSSPVTLPANAKGPLIITRRKRPSGRSGKSGVHKPGAKRRSGRHKAGMKRPSGSQSSGAHRRFNALPLPRKRRRT